MKFAESDPDRPQQITPRGVIASKLCSGEKHTLDEAAELLALFEAYVIQNAIDGMFNNCPDRVRGLMREESE